MLNLINMGYDIGDITVNAFNAIITANVIINYDNIDLSHLDTFIKDKEIIVRDLGQFDDDLEKIFESVDGLEEINDSSVDSGDDSSSIYSKLNESYSLLEFAISKSLDSNVVIICSNNKAIHGISNLLIQICSKWKDVELKIHPTVSPIDYSSSILGAPLNDFVSINLNNPIVPQKELENKINFALNNDFIIFIHNIKGETETDNYDMLKEIVNDFNAESLVGIVNEDSYEICQFKDIDEDWIDENSTMIIGNKLTYQLDGHMISSSDYIVEPKFISQNIDFFERYLKDETPKGLDYDCRFLPCHKSLEACDFCYCPFYPCADGVTGGEWIKDKNVWSCQHCDWIHLENPCQAIREGLEDILKDKDDLKSKHIELLKLRRKCLLDTL